MGGRASDGSERWCKEVVPGRRRWEVVRRVAVAVMRAGRGGVAGVACGRASGGSERWCKEVVVGWRRWEVGRRVAVSGGARRSWWGGGVGRSCGEVVRGVRREVGLGGGGRVMVI